MCSMDDKVGSKTVTISEVRGPNGPLQEVK